VEVFYAQITRIMKSKTITINNTEVTVHSDGSISRPDNRFKDKRIHRTFGTKSNGYRVVGVGKTLPRIHRLVAQAFLSDFSEPLDVDHIDGNRSNNNLSNLRMSTRMENVRAYNTKREGCSSQYRGVCWCKRAKKWIANCMIDYKKKHIGYFDDERDAAMARDAYMFSQGSPKEGLNFPENYNNQP